MYLGRATVPTNQLESFMKVSKLFLNSNEHNTAVDVNEETTLKHTVFSSIEIKGEIISANDNEDENNLNSPLYHTTENDDHNFDQHISINKREDPEPLKKEHQSQSNQIKHTLKSKAVLPIIYKQDKMRCPISNCKFTSMYDSRLRKHTKKIHGEKSCPTCQLVFADSTVLSKHIKHHHTTLTCEFCSYTSKSLGDLGIHQRKHTGSMKCCNQCDYSCLTNCALRLHMESRHNNSEFNCDKCEYKAHTRRMITFHIQKVHKGVRFYCEFCDYKATRPANLRAHQKSVHCKIRFECRFCKFGDSQMSRVKLHEQRNHSVSSEEQVG